MKTPQVPALPGMTPLGLKPYAQVAVERRMMAKADQKPCDIGLFSDDAAQSDLVDKLAGAVRASLEFQKEE